jgi:anti-sigma B factor antagonist
MDAEDAESLAGGAPSGVVARPGRLAARPASGWKRTILSATPFLISSRTSRQKHEYKERAMQIAERESGAVTILDLAGKVTLGDGDTLLKDKLHSLLHQGKKDVLLNLAQVSYVDSAGLGAIVSAYTTMTREGGSLKLSNVTKKLQDLLSITKLLTVFETFDSEDEAIRSYKK